MTGKDAPSERRASRKPLRKKDSEERRGRKLLSKKDSQEEDTDGCCDLDQDRPHNAARRGVSHCCSSDSEDEKQPLAHVRVRVDQRARGDKFSEAQGVDEKNVVESCPAYIPPPAYEEPSAALPNGPPGGAPPDEPLVPPPQVRAQSAEPQLVQAQQANPQARHCADAPRELNGSEIKQIAKSLVDSHSHAIRGPPGACGCDGRRGEADYGASEDHAANKDHVAILDAMHQRWKQSWRI